MANAPLPMQLPPQTLQGFVSYIHQAEELMQPSLKGSATFLWSDETADRAKHIHQGKVLAELFAGNRPVKVSDGLIHDWIGAAFAPRTTLPKALALVQDYNNHKNIYRPEVMDSKLISHHGDDFKIYLRLLKKKVITVVLDTDHDVHYERVSEGEWFCRSHTTRIAEVDDAGTAREKVQPPDVGYGFLWRLDSYWRFAQRLNGVIIECRAISLTRDVPLGLGWIIEPIIKNLPRESLINTLTATKDALAR